MYFAANVSMYNGEHVVFEAEFLSACRRSRRSMFSLYIFHFEQCFIRNLAPYTHVLFDARHLEFLGGHNMFRVLEKGCLYPAIL